MTDSAKMLEKKKYDLIIPLGMSCATAKQLQVRDLRVCAFPFDWNTVNWSIENPDFLWQRARFLETHFNDWMVWENLAWNKDVKPACWLAVIDKKHHLLFPHDYKTFTQEEHEKIRAKYFRRIERLYRGIERSNKILLAVSGNLGPSFDHDNLVKFRTWFHDTLAPHAEVDAFGVFYRAAKDQSCQATDNVYCVDTVHKYGDYDWNYRSRFYSWFDDLQLTKAGVEFGVGEFSPLKYWLGRQLHRLRKKLKSSRTLNFYFDVIRRNCP